MVGMHNTALMFVSEAVSVIISVDIRIDVRVGGVLVMFTFKDFLNLSVGDVYLELFLDDDV